MTPIIPKRLIGTLATLALTLGLVAIAAPPASAARGVWDRVASCESGGRWHIHTGNGYSGGLQFSGSTWRAYGGKRYASSAHRATKSEQIAIARRVLAGQGPGAWPVCSRRAGLTKSNGHASRHATPAGNHGQTRVDSTSAHHAKKASKKTHHASSGTTVRVKRGDTLGKIAHRYHVKGGWKGLWKLNKSTVRNPHAIHVGQVLRITKS